MLVLKRFLIFCALSAASVAQPIFDLYGKNLAVFTTANVLRSEVLAFTFVVLFGAPILAIVLVAVAGFVNAAMATRVFHGVAGVFAIAFALNVLRLVGVQQSALVSMVALLGGVAFVWFLGKSTGFQNWLAILSVLVPVLGVIFVGQTSEVFSSGVINIQSAEKPPGSVLVFVTDEAPLFPLIGTDGLIDAARFPGYAALAESATWYRNATSPSQTTTEAVPALLSGVEPTIGTDPTLRSHPSSLFTLLGGEMPVNANEITTSLCPKVVCVPPDMQSGFVASRFKAFVEDAATVYGHRVLPRNFRSQLPDISNGWGSFGGDSPVEEALLDAQIDKAGRKARLINLKTNGQVSQVKVMRSVVNAVAKSTQPEVFFAHLMLPHRGWTLTGEARLHEIVNKENTNTPADVRGALLDYQQQLMQYLALDREILRMITTLKAADKWDDLTVVITADHGLTLEPGMSKRRDIDFTNASQIDDVYRVPMFVKYPQQPQGVVNDCDVTIVDLLPTIADIFSVTPAWNVDGISLRDACPKRESRDIASPTGSSTFRNSLDTLFERARRYDTIVSRQGGANGVFSTPDMARLVATTSQIAAQPSDIVSSWTVNQLAAFNNIATGLAAVVPAHISGVITVAKTLPKNATFVVTSDGKAAGVIPDVSSLAPGEFRYDAFVNSALLTKGSHTVGLVVATSEATAPVLAVPAPTAGG